jgi:hypothetical protein
MCEDCSLHYHLPPVYAQPLSSTLPHHRNAEMHGRLSRRKHDAPAPDPPPPVEDVFFCGAVRTAVSETGLMAFTINDNRDDGFWIVLGPTREVFEGPRAKANENERGESENARSHMARGGGNEMGQK